METLSALSIMSLDDDDGGGVLFVNSAESAEIGGYAVPKLTNKQVTAAYNAAVAGRAVIVRDALGFLSMPITSASSIDHPAVSAYAVFVDKLLLEYKTNDAGDDDWCDVSGTPVNPSS